MSHEQPEENYDNKLEYDWDSVAQTYQSKVDKKIDEYIGNFGDDGSLVLKRLTSVKDKIGELFPLYQRKEMTLKQVGDDVSERIERETDEEEEYVLREIKNLLDVRGLS